MAKHVCPALTKRGSIKNATLRCVTVRKARPRSWMTVSVDVIADVTVHDANGDRQDESLEKSASIFNNDRKIDDSSTMKSRILRWRLTYTGKRIRLNKSDVWRNVRRNQKFRLQLTQKFSGLTNSFCWLKPGVIAIWGRFLVRWYLTGRLVDPSEFSFICCAKWEATRRWSERCNVEINFNRHTRAFRVLLEVSWREESACNAR